VSQAAYVILFAPGLAFQAISERFSVKILLPAILVALCASLLPLKHLHAASSDLYLGSVPVADQSPGERSRAMPLALMQVLQKLTGLKDFGEYPQLDAELVNAHGMAIAFYYRNRELLLADGSKGEELRLLVEFLPQAVNGLIQAMRLPIWNPQRPPLTIWLMIDDGFSRRIMPIDFEYVWNGMAEAAEARGMPLIRPQPDEQGDYAVDLQLLWGGYTEELADSGPADALLVAALQEGPEWTVRFNLAYTGSSWSWRIRNSDLQDALVDGMNQAIDDISAVNSIAASDQGHWRFEIAVTGLTSAGDYARCLSYLQGLSLVDSVGVMAAGPGRVHFVLSLNALPDYLLRALVSGGRLAASATQGEFVLLP